jgi:hypothetical protein
MASINKPLEGFDEKPLGWDTSEDMRQADRVASLDDVTTYIYQSLVDYQGKWERTAINEWTVRLLYSRHLESGNFVFNRTTGETYTINSIIDEDTKTVRLQGTIAPQKGDKLELDDADMVNFVSAYPQVHAEPETWRDTITYRVQRREPGSLQAHPFDGRKEIKPRVRQTIPDPDHPNFHVAIYGQWFDNLIQFDCWSTTNHGADSLISWFEDFMFRYTWVWKKNGVQEMLYMNRGMDENISRWRDDITNRTLVYYFRTEKITPVRLYDFSQFDIYVQLNSGLSTAPSGVIPPSGYAEVIDGQLKMY